MSIDNRKKLKILHIGNGNAYKIKTIISFLQGRGHEIHFVPTIMPEQKWKNVEYHFFKGPPMIAKLAFLSRINQIRKIVKDIKPDIVHAHNARGPGWWGAFSGHHPFVLHAYGGDVLPFRYKKKDLVHKILTIYTCSKIDKMIVTGKHMVKAASHLHVNENKIKVLPRGVDLKRYKPGLDVASLKEEMGIKNSTPIIFSPRYQVHQSFYNFDTIIKSIPLIKKKYPNVLVIQLYDKSKVNEKLEFEALAQNLGVADNYKIIEAVDNNLMPLLYNLADMVVSVPSTDGFPVSVLEASACGVPMIISKLDFTKEWFVDGKNALLVPVRDHGAIADSVFQLIDNSELKKKMIELNLEKVEEEANYQKCMEELENIYYELIA